MFAKGICLEFKGMKSGKISAQLWGAQGGVQEVLGNDSRLPFFVAVAEMRGRLTF